MPLRSDAADLDSDTSYSTVLELREENRLMRRRRFKPKPTEPQSTFSGLNEAEDNVIRLIDARRVFKRRISKTDADPPSHVRHRKP